MSSAFAFSCFSAKITIFSSISFCLSWSCPLFHQEAPALHFAKLARLVAAHLSHQVELQVILARFKNGTTIKQSQVLLPKPVSLDTTQQVSHISNTHSYCSTSCIVIKHQCNFITLKPLLLFELLKHRILLFFF